MGEAEEYGALAERTRKAFMEQFFNEETGSYGDGGGNILALWMGVPEERYDRVVEALRRSIIASGGHLDTGMLGTRFFFEVLSENGLHDLAVEAMNKRTEPSYGHLAGTGIHHHPGAVG